MAKKSKPVVKSGIVVDREMFLSTIEMSKAILELMTEEFEALRITKGIQEDLRRSMMEIVGYHIQNVSQLSERLHLSMIDRKKSNNNHLN